MIYGTPTEQRKGVRDRCNRLVPTYNRNYNPYEPPPEDRRPDYSPYTSGEPLYDDRPIIIIRLPRKHVIAGASKRKRTAWVWQLGYALTDTSKKDEPTIWACKLCHHDAEFSKGREWYYNSNSLKNAENHLLT